MICDDSASKQKYDIQYLIYFSNCLGQLFIPKDSTK